MEDVERGFQVDRFMAQMFAAAVGDPECFCLCESSYRDIICFCFS